MNSFNGTFLIICCFDLATKTIYRYIKIEICCYGNKAKNHENSIYFEVRLQNSLSFFKSLSPSTVFDYLVILKNDSLLLYKMNALIYHCVERVDIHCTLYFLGPAVWYTDFHPRYGANFSVLGRL